MQIDSETPLLSTIQGPLAGLTVAAEVGPEDTTQPTASTADHVNLSPAALALLREAAGSQPSSEDESGHTQSGHTSDATYADPSLIFGSGDTSEPESSEETINPPIGLSANDRIRLGHLRMQDAAVRSQQFSRIAVAGSLAGSLNTQFTSGPDGRLYATSGDVDVNTDPGSTPEESLVRANTLRRVSSTTSSVLTSNPVQDDVSIHAAQIELEARSQLNEEVLNDIVRAVEFDVEVTRRDSGAAAEAANWTAPPEFSAQVTTDSDDAPVTATDTGLAEAAVVTAPDAAEQSRDETQRRTQFLALLRGDGPQPNPPLQTLDIVA